MSSEWLDTVYGSLPARLQSARLSELCEPGGVQTGPFGSQLHQEDYVEVGTPIITVEHLGENRITHQNLPKVSEADKQRLAKYTLRLGDIVFSRVGSVDRRALVQEGEDGWLFSGRCLRVRPNSGVLDNQWLSYFFGLPAFKEYIRGIAVGATMPSLNTKILSDIPIYFPPLNIQAEAAKTLVKIDDRIALLRETNATLEAIAQALFKSWFVDFDPVHAKQQGRAPEGMDEATAALFPDSFEESALGLVPKGWRVGAFVDICSISSGKRPPDRSDVVSDECPIPLYGGAGLMGFTSASLFNESKILTGRVGTLGKIHIAYPPYWASDNVLVITPNDESVFSFALHWLRSIDVTALNRGSTQPLLTQRDLGAQLGVIPTSGVVAVFEEVVAPLYQRVRDQELQAKTLATLRDTLLPRLISGQLRLPEASL